jgi:hypothetical protein
MIIERNRMVKEEQEEKQQHYTQKYWNINQFDTAVSVESTAIASPSAEGKPNLFMASSSF